MDKGPTGQERRMKNIFRWHGHEKLLIQHVGQSAFRLCFLASGKLCMGHRWRGFGMNHLFRTTLEHYRAAELRMLSCSGNVMG